MWLSLDNNPGHDIVAFTPALRALALRAFVRRGHTLSVSVKAVFTLGRRGMSRYVNPSPTLTFSGFSSMPDAFAPSISSVAKSWSV